MNARVSEVDVHQIWITPQKKTPDDFKLSPVNQCRRLVNVLEESSENQVGPRSFEHFDVRKRKAVAVLPDFRDNKSIDISQRRHLAIDMEHFRLEKIGAIAGYNWFQNRFLFHPERSAHFDSNALFENVQS